MWWLIIVCLLILFWLLAQSYKIYFRRRFCTGLWSADEDYCREAGIDHLLVHFSPQSAQVLIQKDQELVLEKTTRCRWSWSDREWFPFLPARENYTLCLGLEEFPEVLDVEIDYLSGTMFWRSQGELFAELHRFAI